MVDTLCDFDPLSDHGSRLGILNLVLDQLGNVSKVLGEFVEVGLQEH